MAFEDRSYSGNAVPATLTASIINTDTSIPISVSTGWPDGTSGPFHVGIAPAGSDNFTEVVRCSGRTGLTLNVQTVPVSGRGWDGTTASSHAINSVIVPVFTATDADEANQHYSNTGLDHHSQYLNVARHDLSARHGIANLPVGGTPSTSVVADTAQAGTSGTLARSDHKHARESFGSVVAAGPTNANGTAVTLARSDHIHAGGIPILSSAPASPISGQVYIDSATHRVMTWNGTIWVRSVPLTAIGRTGVVVGRTTSFNVPTGGAVGTPVPWNTKTFDSDNFITPDGTTTTTITPSGATAGNYMITVYGQWGALFSGRSFVEILFDGTYNYRVSTTDEDRWTVSALIACTGQSVQVTAWQNSGAAQTVSFAYMTMHRILPTS